MKGELNGELRIYWNKFRGKKCKFKTFYNRVRKGDPIEEAINPERKPHPAVAKYNICEEGRKCTVCGVFKPRDAYSISNDSVRGHSGRCQECVNRIRELKQQGKLPKQKDPYIRKVKEIKREEAPQRYEPPCIELSDLSDDLFREGKYKISAEDLLPAYYYE